MKYCSFIVFFGLCFWTLCAVHPGLAFASESDWAVRCQDGDEQQSAENEALPKPDCEIFQRLVLQESGQRLAEFALGFPDGAEDARGVVVLPLGILLNEPVTMTIDDSQTFSFQMRYCTREGCISFVNLTPGMIDLFRRGREAVIDFKILTGEEISLKMSLRGFSAALEKL